ncbi:MAG TPA: ornithine cyclodeaminase family protein [Gemmatimonadota bacterium]|nr:ornithine cyclodeaminase family protein [Gemmatimonadota bacterium]
MTRIIRQDQVHALLPMAECVDAVEEALIARARGDATLPVRQLMWLPDRSGLLGLMPSRLGPSEIMGVKVISVIPANHGTELDTHQGAVLLFETERGRLLAVIDATSITEIRTAAASAVATRALSRDDAGVLAILGTGVQARSHLEAIRVVRQVRSVRVWDRKPDRARTFARRGSERHGIEVRAVETAREAVRGADLVCTTTAAREPILEGAWLEPGAHVNAVGACFPTARELDTEAVLRSRFFVDTREGALTEAGDFLIPKAAGEVDDDHIVGEIGEVLTGRIHGRRSPEEITVFESLGIGIYDLAAAERVWRNAEAKGIGADLELGGRRSHG